MARRRPRKPTKRDPLAHFAFLEEPGPPVEKKKSVRWDGEVEEPTYLSGLRTSRADTLIDGLILNNPRPAGGGWRNRVTGMGDRHRDKVLQAEFDESQRIDDPQLSSLFNGNDLAQRIVCAKPREMFRRGWVLSFPGTGPAKSQGGPPDGKPKPPAGDNGNTGYQVKPAAGGQGAGIAQSRQDLDDMDRAARKKAGLQMPPGDAQVWAGTIDGAAPDAGEGKPATDKPINAQRPGLPDGQPQAKEQSIVPGSMGDPEPSQGGDNGPYDLDAAQTAEQGESGPPAPGATGIAVPGAVTKSGQGKYDPQDQQSGQDLAKQVELYAANLQLKPRCLESTIFGRLYGGGLLIVGADDGQDVIQPLDENNIRSIKYLTWIDRRFIVAHTYYEEIGPKYGEVQVYNVINPFGNQKNTLIHESRVIRFDGSPVDLLMRRRLAGWTLSVLQAPYDTMRQFDQSFQSIANLMADMSQAVMKINGLAQMISNDPKTLATRMRMVDMSRSSGRMLFLDAENEEFSREPTPLTGVADTLEMQMLRLAAAAEMPVAILFGREPSGLNATGDADFRRFYDMIAGDQTDILQPKLERLYKLICLAKDAPTKGKIPEGGYEFTWHKLYAPSEVEQSTIRLNMAQADDKYIANGVLTEDEVAMSRFRSGDLHLDTEIDGSLRRDRMKTAQLPPSKKEQADTAQKNAEQASKDQFGLTAMKVGAKKPKPPPGRADAYEDDDLRCDSTVSDVILDLQEDYPPEAMDWVRAVDWQGPERIPLKDIDMSGRKKWRASHEDISGYVNRIRGGQRKPILLVKTPGHKKYIVVDGHHRLLAYEKLGKPVLAYCGEVPTTKGPWDTMHDAQHSGPSKLAGGSVPPPPPSGV